MKILSIRYGILRGELLLGNNTAYDGRTEEDILIETFEYVIREKLDCLTDEEVIIHFKKKFQTIKMQTIKDYKSKMKYYADNQQAENSPEPEQ